MQASFIGFKRSHGDILLVVSRDILAPTLKRLSMFVLRAKAKLRDATAEFELYGLAGDAAGELAPGLSGPWSKADVGNASVVSLYPADGQARALWLAPAGEAAPPGPALGHELWLWGEVRSGIATITAPIVEAFVPQMLNYESVGGVNFKKGCYPGPGSRGAQPVPRHAQATRLPRPLARRPCRRARKSSMNPTPTSPAAWWRRPRPRPAAAGTRSSRSRSRPSQGGALTAGSPQGPAIKVQPPPYPLLADV